MNSRGHESPGLAGYDDLIAVHRRWWIRCALVVVASLGGIFGSDWIANLAFRRVMLAGSTIAFIVTASGLLCLPLLMIPLIRARGHMRRVLEEAETRKPE